MAATKIKRTGFGQVEPNHLSAQRTGQIYAQLPAAAAITQLENGQYVKYDYANGQVNFTGVGEWMLVFNEVKLYDDFWRESYKDFAMLKDNYTPGSDTITHSGVGPLKGQMVPRVFKTNIGDIYTTNCVGAAGAKGAKYAGIDIDVGYFLVPDASGFLNVAMNEGTPITVLANVTGDMVWQVVKVYNLADKQPAVKIMRVR